MIARLVDGVVMHVDAVEIVDTKHRVEIRLQAVDRRTEKITLDVETLNVVVAVEEVRPLRRDQSLVEGDAKEVARRGRVKGRVRAQGIATEERRDSATR